MRAKQETAASIARTVQRTAATNVYGFHDRKPSGIYIHSDHMNGIRAEDVLALLNPPILTRIGIRFWQAMESDEYFPESVFPSLLEQTDARPGVLFSHTELFSRVSRVFTRQPKRPGR